MKIKIQRYSTLLSACLVAAACTDDHASSAPAQPAADSSTQAASAAEAEAKVSATDTTPSLSAWTGSFSGLAETQLCALDAVNGVPAVSGTFTVQANQPIALEGWVSTATLQAPPRLKFVLDGTSDFQITAVTGVARDDVAQAYSATNLALSGFKTQLATFAVPAGDYSVILVHEDAGALVICNPKLHIVAN